MFGIDDDIGGMDDDDNDGLDDGDLEAELAAITAGSGAVRKARPKPKTGNIVAPEALDAMVAASLKDVGSDDDDDDDEDDSELLNELAEIAGGSVEEVEVDRPSPPKKAASTGGGVKDILKARIEMYTTAEDNAKKAGDSGKARRFNRGLKTLKDLLKQADAGKTVDPTEIPPEVSVKGTGSVSKPETPKEEEEPPQSTPPVPTRRAPAPPPSDPAPIFESTTTVTPAEPTLPVPLTPAPVAPVNPQLKMLIERKNQYKTAALEAKKAGNSETAIKFIKTVKQFDAVIQALENGQEVDLSRMPPPPGELDQAPAATAPPPVPPRAARKEEAHVQKEVEAPEPTRQEGEEPPADEEDEVLIQASTVMEALQQRLEKYKSVEKAAKDEGNSSKVRRMGRIVKQYEDAIKMHKAGKPIPVDELPTPPGYAPIPVEGGPPKPAPAPSPRPVPKAAPAPAVPGE